MSPRIRERRTWLLVGLVALVAVAAVVVLGRGTHTGQPLDPDNPDRDGAQALARVLSQHGISVAVARSADELAHARVDAATTVLVVNPENLGRTTALGLLDRTSDAALVAIAPGPAPARLLGLRDDPVQVSAHGGARLAAGCADPLAAGLTLDVDGEVGYHGAGCFRRDGASVLVRQGNLTVWGADQALTNDQILRGDNAALALRLLGQRPHLVWYLPSAADVPADEGTSLGHLLPRWLVPGLWLLLLVVVAVAWWRGRRLGPLATEPLPVVVRAAETTEALGRLYRRAGDRAHAAEALRRAARDRWRASLRLGTTSDDAVVTAVAAHTGLPAAQVADLLTGGPPADDSALIALAQTLTRLEEEVRRP